VTCSQKKALWNSIPFRIVVHFRCLVIICGAVGVGCCLTADANAGTRMRVVARQWSRAPAIVELSMPETIIAIGDVHGDYDRLVTLLSAVDVIADVPKRPQDVTWAAGEAIVICTGDLIDKGSNSLGVIQLFRALDRAARVAGGRVVVLMGNHEAEFLADWEGEKTEDFQNELYDAGLDPEAVADGTDPEGIGMFLRSLPFAACVGDWFFSHAGNSDGRTRSTLRRKLEDGVNIDGFAAPILADEGSLLEARLKPMPWWEEEYDVPQTSKDRLQEYAVALEVEHFVIGHQPGAYRFSDGDVREKGEMYQKFNGLMFLIDVGMSSAINYNKGMALVIDKRNGDSVARRVAHDGSSDVLWRSVSKMRMPLKSK
jgi:hypothetical protein